MIVSIAWKNVWRNKLRSFVVIASIAVGVMGDIFMIALMHGWIDQRSKDAIYVESAHIQMEHPSFRQNEEPKFRIDSVFENRSAIDFLPEVAGVSFRSQVLAMATGGYKPSGFIVRGIKPDDEKRVSELYKFLLDSSGNYFEKYRRKPILLSEKTAKDLRLQSYLVDSLDVEWFVEREYPPQVLDSLRSIMGEKYRTKARFFKMLQAKLQTKDYKEFKDGIEKRCAQFRLNKKIELTVRSVTGDEVSTVFRLVGVFKTSNTQFDVKYAYVLDEDLKNLTQWPSDEFHQVAILAKDPDKVNALADTLSSMYPQLEVRTWRKVLPEIAMYSDMLEFYAVIFMSIILFALGFGIVNTMLMVVLERTKELGMLMAIGMTKGRVFRMIITETVMLSMVGGVIGMLLGALLVHVFAQVGINLSAFAEGMEAMGFSAIIYPQLPSVTYIEVTVLVVFTGIFSAIYPARKATKLVPAEAVRTD